MTTPNIFESAIVLALSFSMPGNRKKLATSQVEVDSDQSFIHVAKDLLDSDEVKAVGKFNNEIRTFVKSRACPSPLGRGRYMLANELVKEMDDYLTLAIPAWTSLVDAAVAIYPQRIEEARARLRGNFTATDYPPAGRYRSAFDLDYQYLSFSAAAGLEAISAEIAAKNAQRFESKIQQGAQAILDVLGADLRTLVDRMVDRLTPDADGKPKVFKNTLVTNLTEFLGTLGPRLSIVRGLDGVNEIQRMADEATGILQGVQPQELRENRSTRDTIREGFKQVQLMLDTIMVQKKSSRMITFEDEVQITEAA